MRLEIFQELQDSDVVYGHHPAINFAKGSDQYPEFSRFLELKKLKEDCRDLRKCVERIITKRGIIIIHIRD